MNTRDVCKILVVSVGIAIFLVAVYHAPSAMPARKKRKAKRVGDFTCQNMGNKQPQEPTHNFSIYNQLEAEVQIVYAKILPDMTLVCCPASIAHGARFTFSGTGITALYTVSNYELVDRDLGAKYKLPEQILTERTLPAGETKTDQVQNTAVLYQLPKEEILSVGRWKKILPKDPHLQKQSG